MKDNRLAKVKKFYRKFHRLPSYSEMLKLFSLASKKAVFDIIQKWIQAGLIKKEKNKIAPTERFFSLPFVGIVKAGQPILAEEDKDYLSLDEYLIDDPNSSFVLKVSGDSLINAGIFDGDIVIINKKKTAFSGDIVLAEIDGEWTLKVLRKDRTRKKNYLEAANSKYGPFYPKRKLSIFGVVQGVVRKIN